jgi:hypothetical protein
VGFRYASQIILFQVEFEVLTEENMKVVVFALMMEAAVTPETFVNFYQTTRRYNPEDSHLHFNSTH